MANIRVDKKIEKLFKLSNSAGGGISCEYIGCTNKANFVLVRKLVPDEYYCQTHKNTQPKRKVFRVQELIPDQEVRNLLDWRQVRDYKIIHSFEDLLFNMRSGKIGYEPDFATLRLKYSVGNPKSKNIFDRAIRMGWAVEGEEIP